MPSWRVKLPSTVAHQFWIWMGANIAPINWVLGALGISLGLSLWQVIAVLVLGNLIGMAVFGFFVLMGQQTAVSQMVLSRAAFGRRGAYLPAAMQGLLAVGWCAINTWIRPGVADEKAGDRLVMSVRPETPSKWAGTAFDPQRDKSYRISINVGGDSMTTRGCILGGLLCKSIGWRKLSN